MSLLSLENNEVGVLALWQLTECEEELCALSKSLWEEACRRFRAPTRRKEWVAVRLLLLHLGVEPSAVAYLPSGRPYLVDDKRGISISHTRGYAAVLLSEAGPVGVDIERQDGRVHRVVDRFMNPAEVPANLEDNELTRYLLLHWSARETLFKCLDLEGVDFREHLHVEPFVLQREGILTASESRTMHGHDYTVRYRVTDEYVLTWCRG